MRPEPEQNDPYCLSRGTMRRHVTQPGGMTEEQRQAVAGQVARSHKVIRTGLTTRGLVIGSLSVSFRVPYSIMFIVPLLGILAIAHFGARSEILGKMFAGDLGVRDSAWRAVRKNGCSDRRRCEIINAIV